MINSLKKMLKNSKGFTLIELIAVIAILGILMAIAVPRVMGFTDQARRQADRQQAAIVANAVKMLIATGDVTVETEGTLTLESDDDTLTIEGEEFETVDEAVLQAHIERFAELRSLEHYDSIEIVLDSDGGVIRMEGIIDAGGDDERDTFQGTPVTTGTGEIK